MPKPEVLRHDRRGTSVMIGFILLMLILIILGSIIQTKFIPQIIKSRDIKTSNDLLKEIYPLSTKISNGETYTFNIEAPRYPQIPFFVLPESGSYRVFTEPMNMSINCTIFLPNGTEFHYQKDFYDRSQLNSTYNSSKRLWIFVSYASMPDDVYLFENTALLKTTGEIYNYTIIIIDENKTLKRSIEIPGRNYTVISHEKLSSTPTINLIILLGDLSFSGTTPVSLSFIPVSYGGEFPARNISISFETVVPEYWKAINDSLSEVLHGERKFYVTDKTRNIKDWINLSKKYNQSVKRLSKVNLTWFNASSGVIRIYAYKVVKELGTATSEVRWAGYLNAAYAFHTDFNTTNVTRGEVFKLGVLVLDEYLNPVRLRNITVNVTYNGTVFEPLNNLTVPVNYPPGNKTARIPGPGIDGKAYAYFRVKDSAPPGEYLIRFNVTQWRMEEGNWIPTWWRPVDYIVKVT